MRGRLLAQAAQAAAMSAAHEDVADAHASQAGAAADFPLPAKGQSQERRRSFPGSASLQRFGSALGECTAPLRSGVQV